MTRTETILGQDQMITNRILTSVAVVLLMLLASLDALAQTGAPHAVNYQGVLRKSDGSAQSLQNVLLRLTIVNDTLKLTEVYSEIHSVRTDDLGLFSVELGRGESTQDFTRVPWGAGPLWLYVAVDDGAESGPRSFVPMGRQQIVSVPYAIYAGRSATADTALHVEGFALGFGVAWSNNDRLQFLAPAKEGYLLVSTGTARPEWRSLASMIDSVFVDSLYERVIKDTAFMKGLVDTVIMRVGKDTTFIKTIANDTMLRKLIVRIVDSTLDNRPYYRTIRDSLLRDTTFGSGMTVIIRDRLVKDRIFLESIGRDSIVQRLIASGTVFVEQLFRNTVFRDSLRATIERYLGDLDGRFWGVSGNAGTDPNRNYVGTRDGKDLVIRTNNVERMRFTRDGLTGIGTSMPGFTLDVAGSLNVKHTLHINGDPGTFGYVLTSNGNAAPPSWAPPQRKLWDVSGDVNLEPGTTLVTVQSEAVLPTTRIIISVEDLEDSGFAVAQVVRRTTGSFSVRLSAPIVSRSAKLMYLLINP